MVRQQGCRYIADERTDQPPLRLNIGKGSCIVARLGRAMIGRQRRVSGQGKRETMTRFIKSSFAWQFAGGFLLGAMGMMAAHVTQPELPANAYATR